MKPVADILKQVHDHQFEEELKSVSFKEKTNKSAIQIAEAKVREALQEQLTQKETALTNCKLKSDAMKMPKLSAKKKQRKAQLKAEKIQRTHATKSQLDNAKRS